MRYRSSGTLDLGRHRVIATVTGGDRAVLRQAHEVPVKGRASSTNQSCHHLDVCKKQAKAGNVSGRGGAAVPRPLRNKYATIDEGADRIELRASFSPFLPPPWRRVTLQRSPIARRQSCMNPVVEAQ
eukprot:scaffold132762_cov30-Tisochrysis_lutea.AAC.7